MLGLNGAEQSPAFSPDGKQIAFALQGETGAGIYVSLVGGSKSLQLTSGPQDNGPKWSPDGEQIARWSDWSGQFRELLGDQQDPLDPLDL